MLRRSLIGIGLAVTALLAFQVSGCGDSGGGGNGGSSGGTAGMTGTGGSGSGVAGTTGAGGTTGGGATGGSTSTTAGTTGTGGSGSGAAGTTGTGGSGSGVAGTTGTGGAATGTAGTTGTGGAATGTAGTTGTGGTGVVDPNCPATISDKSTTCTTEGLACPKTCGVESKGTKTCTCTAGVFVCESVAPTCHYPAGTDVTCYRLTTPVPACPAGTTSNAACTAAPCMPCSGYQDSSMTAKTGYCVCGTSKWRCASDKEWPVQ